MKQKFGLQSYIVFTLASTTLALIPTYFDPINIPRLSFLIFSGIIATFIILKTVINRSKKKLTIEIKILLVFILWMLISSILSKNSITDTLLGNERRNLGLLSYISFTAVILLLLLFEKNSLNASVINTLIVAVSINSAYSLLQKFNLDPLPWSSNNSGTIGFFGNPNFSSVFTAMGCIAVFVKLFGNKKILNNILILFFLLLNLYVIDSTKSVQGFITLIVSLIIILSIKIFDSLMVSKSYKNKKYTFFGFLLVVILALMSIKNQILSYLKSEETFLFRLEYFKAGKNMFLQNPIFGVGISGFRDNYRLYREKSSLQYSNYLDEVDSSHNLFIDLFASGGFILGASYCLFVGLIVYRMCSHILNTRITSDQIAIIGVWFVFIIQSLISPPNLSLLIWGFVLSGLIVKFNNSKTDSDINKRYHPQISFKLMTIALFLTISITLQVNINNNGFRSSLESGSIERIKKNIGKWPRSEKEILFAAQLLKENGFLNESVDFAILATNVNSNHFESWLFLAQSNQLNNQEKAEALRNLVRLDPAYPNYAKSVEALP